MYQQTSARRQAKNRKVLAANSASIFRSCAITIAALVMVALHLPASKIALAATACCKVAEVATNGQVTAREINGTRSIRFQVTDSALLRSLKPGAPVYANFDTKLVSLDGKKACCKIVSIDSAPQPAAASAESRSKPGGQTATKAPTTVDVPKVEVKAAEGDTAMAMRGRPATSATGTKEIATPAAAPSNVAIAGAQSEAINPDVIALQTTADLISKDVGFTSLGEVTFRLINRGQVGINVVSKPGALSLAQAPPSNPAGPPISIEIWIGASKITVQQPAMGASQAKTFTVPIPSNYSTPKCLETRDLKIVVDPQKQIAELYDDNNVTEAAGSARPCPDLAIKSIKRHYTGVFNETYQPKVTVINLGNAPSPATQVWGTSLPTGIWPVTGWPELVPTHTIPALDPGETTSFRTGGSVLATNHTAVRVILDRFFEIEESDESNNFQDKQL